MAPERETEVLTEADMQMIRNGLCNITEVNYGNYTVAEVQQAQDLYYRLIGAETIQIIS